MIFVTVLGNLITYLEFNLLDIWITMNTMMKINMADGLIIGNVIQNLTRDEICHQKVHIDELLLFFLIFLVFVRELA